MFLFKRAAIVNLHPWVKATFESLKQTLPPPLQEVEMVPVECEDRHALLSCTLEGTIKEIVMLREPPGVFFSHTRPISPICRSPFFPYLTFKFSF